MAIIRSMWDLLVAPNKKIIKPEHKIQSRLLATILISFALVGTGGFLIQTIFITGVDEKFYTVSSGLALLLIAYFINRKGHLSAAITLTIAMPVLTSFGVVYNKPAENFAFAFAAISVLFAFMFFSVGRGLLVVLAIILSEIMFLAKWPDHAPGGDVVLPSFYVTLISSLLLIFIWHQKQQELIRIDRLRYKEQRLEHAQKIANLGSWVWDIKANQAEWSEQLFKIYGLSKDSFDGDVWSIVEKHTHPDDIQNLQAKINEAITSRKAVDTEYRIFDVNGNEKMLWAEIEVSLDANGEVDHLYGVAQDVSERYATENAIRQSEKELSAILESMQDTYYRTNTAGEIIRISPSAEQLLGFSVDEILGRKMSDFYLESDGREKFLEQLQANNGVVKAYEAPLKHKSKPYVWVSTNAQYYYDEAGNIAGVEGTTRDITSKKQAELEMLKFSAALQQTADSVLIMDRLGRIEYVNSAFESFTGLDKSEIVDKEFSVLKAYLPDDQSIDELWNAASSGEIFTEIFVNRNNPEHQVYEQKTITPIRDSSNQITHFVITGKNITDYMRSQERLQYLAQHDVLTDLPNRSLLMDRLEHAIARRHVDENVAVLFVDLDRFKGINDSLGHEVGDVLLKELAVRLKAAVREGDTVGRLGGDEFAVVLEDVVTESDASHIAQKILDSVEPAFLIGGRNLHVTASIGISMFPGDSADPELLLRYADIAMYRAKDLGKNNFQFYSRELSAKAFERLTIENSLRDALANDEFIIYFQPQYDLKDNKIKAVEALIRWQHSELGLVMPADFVYILEETGIIDSVGDWVLRKSCEQMAQWHAEGFSDLRVCVNVCSRQCNAPGFVNRIKTILDETGLKASALELEITESLLLRNIRSVDEALNQLTAMGVKLAIDDFGTGYSSLSYLKLFPIDTLKIDRSFVRDIEQDKDDMEIVKAILAMGKTLGMLVVAEGVETENQKNMLLEQNCDIAQGFWFSKPVPANELSKLLINGG